MLRLLPAVFGITVFTAIVAANACTITRVEGEGEGEGDAGEGEGEGAGGGEGEGAGGGPEDTDAECGDLIDNDGNGHTDCDDFACQGTTPCGGPEICGDGQDNDHNSFTDCDDFACSGSATTEPDPSCVKTDAVTIQSIEDGTNGNGFTVPIGPVIVTAVRAPAGANVNLFVQEGDDVAGGHTSPEFAGIGVFIINDQVASFPDLAGLELGDCVSMTGKVQEHFGQTQLSFITAFASATGCGPGPTPIVKDIADINDTGADSETLEGVLVTVENVDCSVASSGNSGSFIVKNAAGDELFINGFLMSPAPAIAVDAHFASITGVLTEFDTDTSPPEVRFNLEPRDATDLVQ